MLLGCHLRSHKLIFLFLFVLLFPNSLYIVHWHLAEWHYLCSPRYSTFCLEYSPIVFVTQNIQNFRWNLRSTFIKHPQCPENTRPKCYFVKLVPKRILKLMCKLMTKIGFKSSEPWKIGRILENGEIGNGILFSRNIKNKVMTEWNTGHIWYLIWLPYASLQHLRGVEDKVVDRFISVPGQKAVKGGMTCYDLHFKLAAM